MFAWNMIPLLVLLGLLRQAPVSAAAPPASPAPPAFRISGRVIDAITGTPLPRALVGMGLPDSPQPARIRATDVDGYFVFANIASGKYILAARHRGYISQSFQEHETFSTAIAVGPGMDSENLIFGLRPETSISGQVLDESNDPVRHASVTLFRQEFMLGKRRTLRLTRATTDDEGHYWFWNLPSGTYFVCVSVQPWYRQHNARYRGKEESESDQVRSAPQAEQNRQLDVVYQINFFSNATDLVGATPITLHSGDKAIADVRMLPLPALHVLLRIPPEFAGLNPDVHVIQSLADNSRVKIGTSSFPVGPGLVEVTGVPPGHFQLGITASQGAESRGRSQNLELLGDTEIDLERSAPLVVVSGILRIDDGSPVPQPARVRLRNLASGVWFDAVVSSTGEFSFKNNLVEMGNYELMIVEPQALLIRSLAATGAKTSGRSFEITTAQDVSLTIHASKGTGQITGVARKKEKPASGVMIVLAPVDLKSNPALFLRDQSDSDGSFALNNVVPGRYTLMAIEDGWDLEWADPHVLQKYIARGEIVQIAPNGKAEIKVNVN